MNTQDENALSTSTELVKGNRQFRALSLTDLYSVHVPAQNSVRFASLNSDRREEFVGISINAPLSEIDLKTIDIFFPFLAFRIKNRNFVYYLVSEVK